MFGARLVIISGLLLGGSGCVERTQQHLLESAAAPISVASAARDLGDGRLEWRVIVRANESSRGERWFKRAAPQMTLEVAGQRVPLNRAGTALEGRWRGVRTGHATLSWRAANDSAGLFVELTPTPPDTVTPRFSPLPRTGIVQTAIPLGDTP